MTGSEVKDLFIEMIDDDELSDTTIYILMNNAEEILEDSRDWVILRRKDTTQSHLASHTWETQHATPTGFAYARKVGLRNGNGDIKWLDPTSFEDIEEDKNTNGFYAIDYVNKKVHITGTYTEDYTIVLHYKIRGTEIDADEALIWEGKRGAILAYQMAELYMNGIDGDEVNFQMSSGQLKQYALLRKALIDWDSKLQLQSMGGQIGNA